MLFLEGSLLSKHGRWSDRQVGRFLLPRDPEDAQVAHEHRAVLAVASDRDDQVEPGIARRFHQRIRLQGVDARGVEIGVCAMFDELLQMLRNFQKN